MSPAAHFILGEFEATRGLMTPSDVTADLFSCSDGQLAKCRAAYDNAIASGADESTKTGPSAVEVELRRQLEKAQKAQDEAAAENVKLQEQLDDEQREIGNLNDQLEDQSPVDVDAQLQKKVTVLEQVWFPPDQHALPVCPGTLLNPNLHPRTMRI